MKIEVKYCNELKMFVAYIDEVAFMKNKKESTLYRKLSDWLKSQNK